MDHAGNMMMIVANSPVRQKEGLQGEGEDVAGDQRKEGQRGPPTPGEDVPIGLSRSGVLDARNI